MYHPRQVMGSDRQEVWGRWASATDRSDRPTGDNGIDKVVTDYSNLPREQTRVPLAHRIQLKFDRFSGFINEYFSNISPGGIFIRTDTPEAPGQLLEFEFRLGDGYELIHGRGEVVWARERGEGPERPPGMGVRFIDLSPRSKDLIYKIVDDYVAHGGKPFDLTPPQPAPGSAASTGEAAGENRGSMPEARGATAAPSQPALPETPAAMPPPTVAPMTPTPPPATSATSATVAARAAPPPAPPRAPAPPPAAGDQSALPWRLEIPAIQQLPGVPAITPRSPLESLGGAGGGAGAAVTAGELGYGVVSAGGGAAAGHGIDPLAQVAAALPPLDELAPDVPSLAPAPAPAVPAMPLASPSAPAPAFSSFDVRAPHRRSQLPLIGAVLAVALFGLAVYLLRDTVMAWIERRDTAEAEGASTSSANQAAPAETALPASPGAQRSPADRSQLGAGHAPAAAATPPAAATSGAPGAAGAPRVTPPGSRATALNQPAGSAAAASSGSPAGVGTPSFRPAAAAGAAAAPTATTPTVTAPPVTPTSGAVAGAPGPTAGAPAGRTVLEPVATAGGTAAGAPAASAARLTAVQRITWQPEADGTEVILWGNGEFTSQAYTRERIGGLPVREVIRITGIDRPFPAPRLAVRTPELVQIRTGYHPPQELRIVLDLGGRDVHVAGIEQGPRQLRIHLRAK
jgi:molecular chaperone DnaK